MGVPITYSGNDAKIFKPILDFFGQSKILSGTVDPSSVATSAPIGSLYLNSSTGSLYRKNDAGSSTNWSAIGNSAVITAEATWTPTLTGVGTATNVAGRWRQVGTFYELRLTFTSGTTAASLFSFTLPNGASLDTSATGIQINNTTSNPGVRVGEVSAGGASQSVNAIVTATATDATKLYIGGLINGTVQLTPQNGGSTLDSNAVVSVKAMVPIAGLAGTIPVTYLPVAAKYTGSATSISGSLATIVWATSVYDTNTAMSSGVFTVPAGAGGKYQVNVNVQVTGTIALNSVVDMVLKQNNSTVSEFQTYAGGAMTAQNAQLSDTLNCSAGDTVLVQLSSGATLPVITNSSKTWISIVKVP